ncbi:hypothetical protein [Alkalinema sp. FACHB-956]|uniref:hypothetical protein n=1 Tax=Alkalinema sp. FACHB-956 TaxID=2692768 RepID=UPI001F548A27|nr:hypothetical protein [Alkalinema sp. FACHB-956]
MLQQTIRIENETRNHRGDLLDSTIEYELIEMNDTFGWAVIRANNSEQTMHRVHPDHLRTLEVIRSQVAIKPGTRDLKGYFLKRKSGYAFMGIDDFGWAVICTNEHDASCHHVDPDNLKMTQITKTIKYFHTKK